MKRTALKRYTPINRKRSKPRRGELTRYEKERKRCFAFVRSRGRCEIQGDDACQGVRFMDGGLRERGHLVHLRAKRRFGWGDQNICWGCYHCHIELAHQGKIKLPATYSELPAWRAEHAGRLGK